MPDNKIKIYGTLKAQTEDEIVATTKDIFHQTTKTPQGAYLDDFLDNLETEVANIDTATDDDIDNLFNIVPKGSIIKFDAFGDSSLKRFRVISINGNIAKLLAMDDCGKSNFGEGTKIDFDGGESGQKYADSTLDYALNTTYYNSLSQNIKSAIIDYLVIQRMYDYNTTDDPSYLYHQEYHWEGTYFGISLEDQITVGLRHVFTLDIKDVFDFFNKDRITSSELTNLIFESSTAISENKTPWILSVPSQDENRIYLISSSYGYFAYQSDSALYSAINCLRPVFQIDLSKITYEVEE